MTYDEYVEKEGVGLPITGFEDLVLDYLAALNVDGLWDIPVDDIMDAIYSAQEILPHLTELNEQYTLEGSLPIKGGDSVH